MEHYLKLVTNRVQGRAAGGIQPRMPSLFEPPVLNVSARLPRPAGIFDQAEHRSSPAAEGRGDAAAHSLFAPSAVPALRERAIQAGQGLLAHNRKDDYRIAREQPAMLPLRPPGPPPVPAAPPAAPRQGSAATAATASPQPSVTMAREESAAARSLHPEPRQPALTTQPLKPQAGDSLRTRTVTAPVEHTVVRHLVDGAGPAPVDKIQIRPREMDLGAARPPAGWSQPRVLLNDSVEDTRPQINVVIGRVSVNAVTETAPPARRSAAAPPPALSLDRYLEQRRGRS